MLYFLVKPRHNDSLNHSHPSTYTGDMQMRMTGNNRYQRKHSEPVTQFTARIHTETFKKLDKLCRAKNVSINFMLNRALTDGLKRMC